MDDQTPLTALPFRDFSERFLHIRTKDRRVVPFRLNVVQERLDRKIEELQAAGKPVRIIILKARQEGVSTYSVGRGYQFATTNTGSTGLMVCHDDQSTKEMFDKARLMYDLAPRRPMVNHNNRTELDFRNPNKRRRRAEPGLLSKFIVATAGKLNIGRSFTLQFVHLSEVAFWKNASNVLLGIEQAIPRDAGTIEIIESTANGVGGEFFERFKRAENPKTAGDWVAMFFAWWDFPEYRIPLSNGEMLPIPSCIDDVEQFKREEMELKALYGLDDEQLNWRRWCIVNQCGNKMDKFRQEYPASPEEAFITSGRPIFNQQRIMFRIRALRADDLRRIGNRQAPRVQVGNVSRRENKLVWSPNPEGTLRVYRWPERDHEYVIGADTAEGITVGDDSDFCAAHVFDRYTYEQVAVFQGRVTPTEFKDILWLLGHYYNKAKLAPESNNHGHTVCVGLTEMNYPNIYLRQDFDELGNTVLERPGWRTDLKTRPILVDAVDHAINTNLAKFNDIPTLEEFLTFVKHPKTGKPKGAEGCHDDLVMSAGITIAVMNWGDHKTPQSEKLDMERLRPDQQMVRRYIGNLSKQYRDERRRMVGS